MYWLRLTWLDGSTTDLECFTYRRDGQEVHVTYSQGDTDVFFPIVNVVVLQHTDDDSQENR